MNKVNKQEVKNKIWLEEITEITSIENWFKFLEWITIIAIFKFISLTTGSIIGEIITTISFLFLINYLYIQFYKLFKQRYRFSKWVSIFSTIIVAVATFWFVVEVVEKIASKY